jgi:hypothetical protein
MALPKKTNVEDDDKAGGLALKVKDLEEQLRRAQEEIRAFEQTSDPPSVVTTSTSSTLGPVSHKEYLFRCLVSINNCLWHVGVNTFQFGQLIGRRRLGHDFLSL